MSSALTTSTEAPTANGRVKLSEFSSRADLRAYLDLIPNIDQRRVFIYFFGHKTDGVSWCSDCVNAAPVLQKCLDDSELFSANDEFISVDVGDRDIWKNPENEYRHDKDIRLERIPTLIQWKTVTFF
jgi:hypothetical protein